MKYEKNLTNLETETWNAHVSIVPESTKSRERQEKSSSQTLLTQNYIYITFFSL